MKSKAPQVSSVKASIGHTESAAGLVGAHTILLQSEYLRNAINTQLQALNHLISMPFISLLAKTPTQSINLDFVELNSYGISSFGYSGTIAHALFQRCTTCETNRFSSHSLCFLLYRRCSFLWQGSVHPFSQELVSTSKGHMFRSSSSGPLLRLVANHVVIQQISKLRIHTILQLSRTERCLGHARRQASRAGVCAPPLVAVAYSYYISTNWTVN